MIDWIVAVLAVLGAALMLVASLGLLRLPDTLMRLSAATKASSAGVALIMAGVGLAFGGSAAVQSFVVIAFVLLTAPVAAHTIARGAYVAGLQLWEETVRDDLADSGELARTVEAGREAMRARREREDDDARDASA